MKNQPLAILIADLHLCHTPPSARSVESDWYGVMGRTLDELRELVDYYGKPPVICAGDIFDKWNSSPQLINFAINYLPRMYAIPGQHDLPLHNYDDLEKSAYQTLVEAGKIVNLPPGEPCTLNSTEGPSKRGLAIVGFPYGFEIKKFTGDADGALKVAVIHSYIWARACSYPGAPKEQRVGGYKKQLNGYDVAVFGDNHHCFESKAGGCLVWNCGTLMRRKMDEKHLTPSVGVLYEDGSVEVKLISTSSEDKFADPIEDLPETSIEMREFLQELSSLEKDSWDFAEAVKRYMEGNRLGSDTKKVLLEALEG